MADQVSEEGQVAEEVVETPASEPETVEESTLVDEEEKVI